MTSTLRDQRGYSLAELVVVMGIFTIIMMISSYAFDRLVSTGGHQVRTSASSIEGVVGLEMLRRDVSHAGYGLPWSFRTPPAGPFSEVNAPPAADLAVTDFDSFKESTPHALLVHPAGSSTEYPKSDYLVVKSALLTLAKDNSSVGRWGYLNYSTSGGAVQSYIKRIGDANSDLRNGAVKDHVVTIMSTVASSGAQNRTLLNTAAEFSYEVTDNFVAPADFQPSDPSSSYIVYGIADRAPAMPYNRADYYVSRPAAGDANFKIPASCNPGTGILFKAVANHQNGYFTPLPLLNCVGDLKVIYTLDMDENGNNAYFPATSPSVTALTPEDLRKKLRSVTVFVMAHDGKKDTGYKYPDDEVYMGFRQGSVKLSSGTTWSAAQMEKKFPSWRNYRWKVYAVPVNPKNMQN